MQLSTVLAVQEVPNCLPSGLVRFTLNLALGRICAALTGGFNCFFGAALRAAIGETRFVRLKLKFLRANHANSDRKGHPQTPLTVYGATIEAAPSSSGFVRTGRDQH